MVVFARGLSLTRLGCEDIRELCWGCVCTRVCTRDLHQGVLEGCGVRM